jgi:hypothetical protein
MCSGLDTTFNPWAQLSPYAQQMLAAQGLQGWEGWLDRIGDLLKELLSLPAQTGRVLTRLERGQLTFNAPEVGRQIYHLETAVNRLVGGLVFAALLFSGVLVYRANAFVTAYIFWGLSAAAFLWMAFLAGGHRPR